MSGIHVLVCLLFNIVHGMEVNTQYNIFLQTTGVELLVKHVNIPDSKDSVVCNTMYSVNDMYFS